jgi:hypothetical protein
LKTRASNLIRWTGLAAILAGIIFAGIQPFHPPDEVSSVTTSAWAIITPLKMVMCLFFLVGVLGIYARQVEESGRLGLLGYILFSLSWWLQTGFVFAEAFVAPPLAAVAPGFVDGLLRSIAASQATDVDLGALPALYSLLGILYMLGGLVLGIASLRARVFPRWAAGLLAATAVLTPFAALLPHQIQRLAAVPMGIALIGLGYALWTDWREQAPAESSEPTAGELRRAA